MSILAECVLVIAGVAAAVTGARYLTGLWSPVIKLRPEWEVRRAAKIARIDDARNRRVNEPRPVPQWQPPNNDRGPKAH